MERFFRQSPDRKEALTSDCSTEEDHGIGCSQDVTIKNCSMYQGNEFYLGKIGIKNKRPSSYGVNRLVRSLCLTSVYKKENKKSPFYVCAKSLQLCPTLC